MIWVDPDNLTSTIEQVGHRLEEEGYRMRPLHILPPNQEFDPEDDPGSISSIYSKLSKLPSRGLDHSEVRSKLYAMQNIAVDVGLANIGIAKPNSSVDFTTLPSLRKFLNVDHATNISNAVTFVLADWGITPEPTKPKQNAARKRKRVKMTGSQNAVGDVMMSQPSVERYETRGRSSQTEGGAGITMSQPERGIYGTRTGLRNKSRRAGF